MGTDHVFTMTRASWEDERGGRDEREILRSTGLFSFVTDAMVPFLLTFKGNELWPSSKYSDSILIVYKNHEQFISPFLMKILFVCSDKSLVANKLRVEFKWKDISAKSLLLVMILFLVLKLLLCLGMWSTEPGMG